MQHYPGPYHLRIAVPRGQTWQILGRYFKSAAEMKSTMDFIIKSHPKTIISAAGPVSKKAGGIGFYFNPRWEEIPIGPAA